MLKEYTEDAINPVLFKYSKITTHKDRVYQKYWNQYHEHFIEADIQQPVCKGRSI